MKKLIINRINSTLNLLKEKYINEYDYSNFSSYDFMYKDKVKDVIESKLEFDEKMFDESIKLALNKIDLKNFYSINFDSLYGLNQLKENNWLINDFKRMLEERIFRKDTNSKDDFNDLVYKAIEFNTIENYFDLLQKKIGPIYQHLDNDISQASASIEKLKSASHFLLDKMGDLSFKDLYEMDSELIRILFDSFKNKNFLIKIANFIGRTSEIENKKILRNPIKKINLKNNKFELYNPSKINGIKIGNKISSIIPYQLSMMHDDMLNKIFKLNFLENKLLIFDQKQKLLNNLNVKNNNTFSEQKNNGPFILCIDSSYSMKNFGEYYAKAFSLAIIDEAQKQNRECYIINFSDKLNVLKISKINDDFDKIKDFLKNSFHNGTNLDMAISMSLDLIEENEFITADIIVLSDFDVFPVSSNLWNKIQKVKRINKTRFYAFVIDRMPIRSLVEDYYDYKWVFNGTSESINKIEKTLKNNLE